MREWGLGVCAWVSLRVCVCVSHDVLNVNYMCVCVWSNGNSNVTLESVCTCVLLRDHVSLLWADCWRRMNSWFILKFCYSITTRETITKLCMIWLQSMFPHLSLHQYPFPSTNVPRLALSLAFWSIWFAVQVLEGFHCVPLAFSTQFLPRKIISNWRCHSASFSVLSAHSTTFVTSLQTWTCPPDPCFFIGHVFLCVISFFDLAHLILLLAVLCLYLWHCVFWLGCILDF